MPSFPSWQVVTILPLAGLWQTLQWYRHPIRSSRLRQGITIAWQLPEVPTCRFRWPTRLGSLSIIPSTKLVALTRSLPLSSLVILPYEVILVRGPRHMCLVIVRGSILTILRRTCRTCPRVSRRPRRQHFLGDVPLTMRNLPSTVLGLPRTRPSPPCTLVRSLRPPGLLASWLEPTLKPSLIRLLALNPLIRVPLGHPRKLTLKVTRLHRRNPRGCPPLYAPTRHAPSNGIPPQLLT